MPPKISIRLSTLLSWFNLIVSGLFAVSGIIFGGLMGTMGNLLMVVVLMGSITLHSYAALQLRKSLVNPAVPLGRQTGVGIRFIGYIALFLAVTYGSSSWYVLGHAKEMLQQVQLPAEYKNIDMSGAIHKSAIFMLIFSASVLINVFLNFRLYRWYLLMQQPDDRGSNA